jgi:hypothetical protein
MEPPSNIKASNVLWKQHSQYLLRNCDPSMSRSGVIYLYNEPERHTLTAASLSCEELARWAQNKGYAGRLWFEDGLSFLEIDTSKTPNT